MRPDDPFVPVDEQLVLERDDAYGLLEVRGWSPGPAGIALLQLRGVAIELDVAEAGALAAAVVTDPPRAGRSLAALLGRDRASAVVSVANGLLPPGAERVQSRRRRGRRLSNADHPATRLALLQIELDDLSLTPPARAVALVEAAAAGVLLGGGLGVGGAVRHHAAAAAELLDAVGDDVDIAGADAVELAAACRAAAGVLEEAGDTQRAGRLRQRAASFANRRRRGGALAAAMALPARRPDLLDAAAERPASARLAAVPSTVPPVDVGGLPVPVVARARWRGAAELEVLATGAPDGVWWARAVREDGTPLAVVPVSHGRARMLLPPGVHVAVDVTHRPDVSAPSPARRATEAALRAGVDACRAHRVGDRWTAADQWRRCAGSWAEAGDDTRAGLAAAYADGRAQPSQPSRPFLVDRLR
jgi:hypothetical protein